MLPILKRTSAAQSSYNQHKPLSITKQMNHSDMKNPAFTQSYRKDNKIKVGGGFRLALQQNQKQQAVKSYQSQHNHPSKTIIYASKKSTTDLSTDIRLIQKKIRQCQKKIEEDKKKKIQQQRKNQENCYDNDFQKVIQRQIQLQNRQKTQQMKGFDYLTNPGGPPAQQPQPFIQSQPYIPPPPQFNITDGIEKLQKFYQNSLKKKFERREIFPHKACRRKTPKLYITQKTNALSKHGKPLTEEEHKFRVMTKQITPQQIYPVIPGFSVVKDNLSKNIVAYLGDYKPFIQKTKQKVQKQVKKQQEQMLIENSSSRGIQVNS